MAGPRSSPHSVSSLGAGYGSGPPCWCWAVNIGLGYGQNAVRGLIWTFGQTEASQFTKNLVFFVFIFSFAMLRLWVTLSIVTFGLKASYVYGEND
ncbi:hypothetical protein ACQR09_18410 [Bradyrhizobium oligotrophicum]|uniref:hypothetical protein n=1 Tax=Bradyrhizobium oligotrophicum TaxID=44255 RepID=UPI003EB8ECE8